MKLMGKILIFVVLALAIILPFHLCGQTNTTPQKTPEPNIPLSISGFKVSYVSDTGATVSWVTNKPATGKVEYGTDTSFGLSATASTQSVSTHSTVLKGLKPATIYHARASATDAGGKTIISYDVPFTTYERELIAFTTLQAGKYSTFVINADGSNQALLIGSFDRYPGMSWSPDGTKIAYIKHWEYDKDRTDDIFVNDFDGSNPKQVTDFGNEEYMELAWSPDSKRIAYVGTGDQHYYRQLYVINADGSKLKWLTGGPSDCSISGPLFWSVDGQKIYFRYARYGENEYPYYRAYGKRVTADYKNYSINADGSNQTLIKDDFLHHTLSPDGLKFATVIYTSDTPQIFIVNSDGSDKTLLTYGSEPSWAPDDNRIAFISAKNELCIINKDGTNQKTLGHDCLHPVWLVQ